MISTYKALKVIQEQAESRQTDQGDNLKELVPQLDVGRVTNDNILLRKLHPGLPSYTCLVILVSRNQGKMRWL